MNESNALDLVEEELEEEKDFLNFSFAGKEDMMKSIVEKVEKLEVNFWLIF